MSLAPTPVKNELAPIGAAVVGTKFGLDVLEIPSKHVSDLCSDYVDFMGETGRRSLLRMMGIPKSFFDKQPDKTRMDILANQKSVVTSDVGTILALVDNNEIVYCAKNNPNAMFELTSAPGQTWDVGRMDYNRGVYSYRHIQDKTKVGEYQPAVFVQMPVFNQSDIDVEVGLFKLKCANGMVDPVTSHKSRINPSNLSTGVLNAVLDAFKQQVSGLDNFYTEFIGNLKADVVSGTDMARDIYTDMMLEGRVSKSLIKKCSQHLDLVDAGELVDPVSPQTVTTMYDVMDAATFYAQQLPSGSSERSAQMAVFKYFFSKYKSLITAKVPCISLVGEA